MTATSVAPVPTSTFPRKGVFYTALAAGVFLVASNIAMFVVIAVFGISKMASPADISMELSAVDKACVAVLHNGGVPEDCSRMYRLDLIP
ncbi:MAG: hypothetical protein E6R04_03135 [Spirochaetes bacterium]|nr:MAG: hypothetical protein E6R04_03135 [Spirochaetota bacterium]